MRSPHAVVFSAVLPCACACVQAERAKNLSAAGVSCAQARAAVVDLGIDASIDSSSERRVFSRPPAPIPAASQPEREAQLKAVDAELVAKQVHGAALARALERDAPVTRRHNHTGTW